MAISLVIFTTRARKSLKNSNNVVERQKQTKIRKKKTSQFRSKYTLTGEGNGNPFQCSCLKNPRDRKPGGLPSMGHTELDTTEAT